MNSNKMLVLTSQQICNLFLPRVVESFYFFMFFILFFFYFFFIHISTVYYIFRNNYMINAAMGTIYYQQSGKNKNS